MHRVSSADQMPLPIRNDRLLEEPFIEQLSVRKERLINLHQHRNRNCWFSFLLQRVRGATPKQQQQWRCITGASREREYPRPKKNGWLIHHHQRLVIPLRLI